MATVEFFKDLPPEDPKNRPCTIVGKAEYIKRISYESVVKFLGSRVDDEVCTGLFLAGITVKLGSMRLDMEISCRTPHCFFQW